MQLPPLYSVGAPNNPPAASDFPTAGYFYVIGNTVYKAASRTPRTRRRTSRGLRPVHRDHGGVNDGANQRRPSGLLSESGILLLPSTPPDRPRQADHDAAQEHSADRARSRCNTTGSACAGRPIRSRRPSPTSAWSMPTATAPTTPWSWSMRCGSPTSRGVAPRALL